MRNVFIAVAIMTATPVMADEVQDFKAMPNRTFVCTTNVYDLPNTVQWSIHPVELKVMWQTGTDPVTLLNIMSFGTGRTINVPRAEAHQPYDDKPTYWTDHTQYGENPGTWRVGIAGIVGDTGTLQFFNSQGGATIYSCTEPLQ